MSYSSYSESLRAEQQRQLDHALAESMQPRPEPVAVPVPYPPLNKPQTPAAVPALPKGGRL